MKEIGGYFGLELQQKQDGLHSEALRLNSARNCFNYILRANGYSHIYIPYYTCEVMLEPVRREGISYTFYHINKDLEPVFLPELNESEAFLYTNYFGLKQSAVKRLALYYGKQLIVDNSQALFADRIEGIDSFYSPRKFVGVSDGAYLYSNKLLNIDLEKDTSYERVSHLIKRLDVDASFGYSDFTQNDASLIGQPIKGMSNFSEALLCSIDFSTIAKRRQQNFVFLHKHLSCSNSLKVELKTDEVPMVYPYLSDDGNLRKHLIGNKIYVAQYWKNVVEWTMDGIEPVLANNLIPLPIDQRYGISEMDFIISIIKQHESK